MYVYDFCYYELIRGIYYNKFKIDQNPEYYQCRASYHQFDNLRISRSECYSRKLRPIEREDMSASFYRPRLAGARSVHKRTRGFVLNTCSVSQSIPSISHYTLFACFESDAHWSECLRLEIDTFLYQNVRWFPAKISLLYTPRGMFSCRSVRVPASEMSIDDVRL